jgi:peptidyl-prolyl cis-trans isomerase A (cyclophilin A)
MTMKPLFVLVSCWLAMSLWGCGNEAKPQNQATAPKPEPAASQPRPESQAVAEPAPAAFADERAPDTYAVKLETTKGEIIIDVTRQWAPRGADRFYTLVKSGFYDDVAFFRVISNFMAQVGISGDPNQNALWRERRIPDDAPGQSNVRAMVTFATSGPNSRTTQFFINFADNSRLDAMGFAPFGKVRDMGIADALNAEYGEGAPRGNGPFQGRLQKEGNAYLKAEFPRLDYIRKATVL